MASVYVSSFTMMAIAMDRYVVIVYPLRPRMTLRIGGVVIIMSWIAAILMSLPYALYARVYFEWLNIVENRAKSTSRFIFQAFKNIDFQQR